jgi:hypothetical protein
MTWGSIMHRNPVVCLRCGGAGFEHLSTGHLDGSRGPGASWRVRCLGCGAVWLAMALLESLHEGKPLEWFSPGAE